VLVMRGQANLLEDLEAGDDFDTIRQLFSELEASENALRLLEATSGGDGVKIFIGAEHRMFVNTGCSLVIAPYHNADKNVIGAIGVLGPRHMNYARIIPMVDYTSRAIAAVLS
ncbi:MAG: heat-inducible transcriptional repressor HrcA, partial [Candidatus Puniceispirillaceae bacterium]